MKSLPLGWLLSPRSARRAARGRRSRRGVLLLVVLSMLVLFALIGITFVLVASQSRRAMRGEARQDQQTDTPSRLLDDVFNQIVRDTTNPRSSLRGHSLLNDMYGNDGATGEVASANPLAGGQFVEIVSTVVTPDPRGLVSLPRLQQTPGFYNGCVLTMTSGNAQGQSTRIVGWGFSAANEFVIRVLATDAINATSVTTPTTPVNKFVINGRPFNGTGFGFNTTNGKIDAAGEFATVPPVFVPFALLPNGRYFPTTAGDPGYLATYLQFGGVGGADEDHDAPTPQDMLISYSPIDPTPASPSQSAIVPSMHRPDLLTHVRAIAGFSAAPLLRIARDRMCSMRPQRLDHPRFPAINETGGPWDVDNDGDGISDSIWIDVGIPAQTAPDGRRFKPLAAIRVMDLDGRLNVNAHGSLAEVDPNFARPGNPLMATPSPQYTWGKYASTTANYFLGQGYGPADVSLAPLFTTSTAYMNLFVGDGTREGRYGLRGTMAIPALPGPNNAISALGLLKYFEYPVANYPMSPTPVTGYPNVLTAFAQEPDLWARGFIGLDVRGTPLTPGRGTLGETQNNPYDINLSRKARTAVTGGVDNPFTPAEFESVLRLYDLDSVTLPSRLRTLLDTGRPLQAIRNMITTDSFDVPTPGMIAPPEIRNGASASQHIVDLLKLRGPLMTTAQLATLLPPELAAGLRMDLNRPFGNARDDNGNGVVDEPAEAASAVEKVWFVGNQPAAPATPTALASFSNVTFDHNNDGVPDVTDGQARQLYARHLYVLMMLLKPAALQINFDPNTADSPAETARGLAQWAVNVVDYRDRDAIMTPFKYMEDPFAAGWTANYDITTVGAGEGVVWGCERPELLITETLAFHDRRTEDLDNDDGPMPGNTTTSTSKDEDFDQRLRPQGSFFVELYNPWNTQSSTIDATGAPNTTGYPNTFEVPGEFYDVSTYVPTGVQLNRRAGGTANGYPVWRMLITKGDFIPGSTDRKDPDDPDLSKRPVASPTPALTDDVERSVYFVDVTNVGTPITGHGTAYYSTLAVDPVLPGRYAVVGSSGFQTGTPTQYVSPLGRRATWPVADDTSPNYTTNNRCIVLKPGLGPNTNQVEIYNNGGTEPVPILGGGTPPNNVAPAVAAVVNMQVVAGVGQAQSLSISEPTGVAADPMYPGATPLGTGPESSYTTVKDQPLDQKRALDNPTEWAALGKNGTTHNFRTVHLQRLADPTRPYDPQTNPYLTVDSSSVDLTVFSGVDQSGNLEKGITPADTGLPSLQRGDNEAATAATEKNNLWAHQVANKDAVKTPLEATSTQIFKYFMRHSLGYINKFTTTPPPVTVQPPNDNSPVNAFGNGNANGPQYVGSPNIAPFPWLCWNNRPFVGSTELMMVPKSRSSRLLSDYQMSTGGVPYYTASAPPTTAGFDHTFNFFQVQTNAADRTHFYRLFDYVGVPSRFVGTETTFNPANLVNAFTSSGITEAQTFSQYHAPFNKLANFREPGKININTIPSDTNTGTTSTVWASIFNGAPGPAWQDVSGSRRGYGTTAPTELVADSTWPSYFSNPFRSAAGVALAMPNKAASPPADRREIDVTLLRPVGTTPDGTGGQLSGTVPLLGYTSTGLIDNTARNPYFRYQNLQRMSNAVTTRSNVYAVWITVGYFEVSRAPNKPSGTEPDFTIYPDGLQLGAELGSDSGNVKRHRGFYIFDRSIPVGFEPGKDHNIENGVLLRRFIE